MRPMGLGSLDSLVDRGPSRLILVGDLTCTNLWVVCKCIGACSRDMDKAQATHHGATPAGVRATWAGSPVRLWGPKIILSDVTQEPLLLTVPCRQAQRERVRGCGCQVGQILAECKMSGGFACQFLPISGNPSAPKFGSLSGESLHLPPSGPTFSEIWRAVPSSCPVVQRRTASPSQARLAYSLARPPSHHRRRARMRWCVRCRRAEAADGR